MIYDITLLISDRKVKSPEEKLSNPDPEFFRMFIKKDNFLKFHILKDPVEDHVTTYSVEFINLGKDIIDYFKNNIVESIVIRVGTRKDTGSVPIYDLLKLYIKPLKIIMPEPNKSMVNNVSIIGISNTNYALMNDKTFSTTLQTNDIPQSITTSLSQTGITQKYNGSIPEGYILMRWGELRKMDGKFVASIQDKNPGNKRPIVGEIGLVGSHTLSDGNVNAIYQREEYGLYNKIRDIVIKYSGRSSFKQVTYPDGTTRKVEAFQTIKDLISIWAPAYGNANKNYDKSSTENYINYVAQRTNLNTTDIFQPSDIKAVAKAMIEYESGYSQESLQQWWTDSMYDSVIDSILNNENKWDYYKRVEASYGNNSPLELINTGEMISGPSQMAGGIQSYGSSNSLLNKETMQTGINILYNVLNSLNMKYGIQTLNDTFASGGVSNFVYPNVIIPNLDAFNTIKYIYEWYPPLQLNSAWILDDALINDIDDIKIGQTVFTPLNLFNLEALPTPMLTIYNFIKKMTGEDAVTKFFTVYDKNFYFKDYDLPKFKALCYNHRCLIDNKETTIFPENSTFNIIIPNLDDHNSNSITSNKKEINVSETLNVETNFDAVEFKKRISYLTKQMENEPELIYFKSTFNDLKYFQFGKKYLFTDGKDSKPLTPYKMLQTFEQQNGFLNVTHDILFYQSDLDLSSVVADNMV